MKISEYIAETRSLDDRLHNEFDHDEYLIIELLDVIGRRNENVLLWFSAGLTEDDEIPEYPNKLIIPKFESNKR